MLVLCRVPADRLPGLPVGEEPLGDPPGVVGDDGIRGVEDRLGRAEVLFEQDGGGVREGLLELQDVADIRRPEPVDRLIRVSDHADVAVLASEQEDELVLGTIGVLELVDEDLGKPFLIGPTDLVVALQDHDRLHEQVVEIHGVGGQQPTLVLGIDVGDAAVKRIPARRTLIRKPSRVDQFGLGLADDRCDGARCEALGVEPVLGDHELDQTT